MTDMIYSILLICMLIIDSSVARDVIIDMNYNSKITNLAKFWTNTGFSPPKPGLNVKKFLLSKDVAMNLAYISSIPGEGIKRVRVHWLLDLVTLSPDGKDWNFIHLDKFIHRIHSNKLSLGFELMGNPGNIFINYKQNKTHVFEKLTNLVTTILNRYSDFYGPNYVSQWKFESWNEPDLKMYNIFNFDLPDFKEYIMAISKGFQSYNNSLKLQFGGPAGLFKSTKTHILCKGIMNFCNQDPNACNFDFVSFHKKGNGSTFNVVSETKSLLSKLKTNYKNFSTALFMNNEADLMSGWWKSFSWRGDVRYAAAAAHIIYLLKDFNYPKIEISFDNGFINFHPHYFTQRTLLARFQMNNSVNNQCYSEFIRKPIFTSMYFLSLLGNKKLPVQWMNENKNSDNEIIYATYNNDTCKHFCYITILIIKSSDTMLQNDTTTNISLTVSLLKHYNNISRISVRTINNLLSNPMKIWHENGSPSIPSKMLLKNMRDAEGPHLLEMRQIEGNFVKVNISSPLPSLTLITICSNQIKTPCKIKNLRSFNVTFNEILLFWTDKSISSCIKTYVIEHRYSKLDKFKRINAENVVMLSYQYVVKNDANDFTESITGFYRIYGIDYWERTGPYSKELCYGCFK